MRLNNIFDLFFQNFDLNLLFGHDNRAEEFDEFKGKGYLSHLICNSIGRYLKCVAIIEIRGIIRTPLVFNDLIGITMKAVAVVCKSVKNADNR